MLSEVGGVWDWLQSTQLQKGTVPGSFITPESWLQDGFKVCVAEDFALHDTVVLLPMEMWALTKHE